MNIGQNHPPGYCAKCHERLLHEGEVTAAGAGLLCPGCFEIMEILEQKDIREAVEDTQGGARGVSYARHQERARRLFDENGILRRDLGAEGWSEGGKTSLEDIRKLAEIIRAPGQAPSMMYIGGDGIDLDDGSHIAPGVYRDGECIEDWREPGDPETVFVPEPMFSAEDLAKIEAQMEAALVEKGTIGSLGLTQREILAMGGFSSPEDMREKLFGPSLPDDTWGEPLMKAALRSLEEIDDLADAKKEAIADKVERGLDGASRVLEHLHKCFKTDLPPGFFPGDGETVDVDIRRAGSLLVSDETSEWPDVLVPPGGLFSTRMARRWPWWRRVWARLQRDPRCKAGIPGVIESITIDGHTFDVSGEPGGLSYDSRSRWRRALAAVGCFCREFWPALCKQTWTDEPTVCSYDPKTGIHQEEIARPGPAGYVPSDPGVNETNGGR